MALDKQIARVDFTGGLETKLDERLVVPGKLLTLQNAAFEEAGSLRRRDGLFGALATSPVTHRGLALFKDELLLQAGASLYSFADANDTFYSRGTISSVTLQKQEIVRTGGAQDSYDSASTGGFTAYVWMDYDAAGTLNGIKAMIRDESTKAIVLDTTTIKDNTGYSPRVVAVTGAFLFLYGGAATTLYCKVVQTSAPTTVGTETALVTDFNAATPIMDACADGANGFVYYSSSSASANSTKAFRVTRSGTTPSVASGPVAVTTQAQLDRAGIVGMAMATFSSTAIGCYALVNSSAAAGAGMWGAVVSDAMAVTAAATNHDTAAACIPTLGAANLIAVLNGSTMNVFTDRFDQFEVAAAVVTIRRTTLDVTNAVLTGPATWTNSAHRTNGTNGPWLAGKAFASGGVVYVPLSIIEGGTGELQNTWFLVTDSTQIVGKALYATYGAQQIFTARLMASSVVQIDSSTYALLAPEIGFLSSGGGLVTSPTGLSRIVVSLYGSTTSVRDQLGDATFLAGGVLSSYDGSTVSEANFHLFPEVVTAVTGAAGNVTAGVHLISALYRWLDASGNIHRSAPSVPISYTAPGGAIATVTIPTLFMTSKVDVSIEVYMTPAGGTTFYLVNGAADPIPNSFSAATATYSVNVADGTAGVVGTPATGLQAGELLYTTGGILENIGPPACSVLGVHQERLFIDTETMGEFQYSQPRINNVGLGWNDRLRGQLTRPGETITGFLSLDDKLLIFSHERPYILSGSGPNTTGGQNGYQLFEVTADVGCIEPRSLIRFPGGVLFKSRKGWYVMDRGLSARYIGSAVAAFDAQNVTSAVLCGDKHEIRITTTSADGATLVYNYDEDQWATYVGQLATDAVWWTNTERYVWTNSGTAVRQETPGTRTDASGAGIVVQFQTSWLHLAEAIHGFQRVWRMILTGAKIGTHVSSLTILAEYDYGDGNISSATMTVADTSVLSDAGSTNEVTWVLRWHMPIQKCAAVRFTITDTPATNSSGLYGFTSLTLEVGTKKGARKFRAGQTF